MKTILDRLVVGLFSCLLTLQTPFSINAEYLERAYSRPYVELPDYKSDNLYDNVKDMVVLSQYIYLHAEMVNEAEEEPSTGGFWDRKKPSPELIEERRTVLESAKTVGEVVDLSHHDAFSMEKGGNNVAESHKVVKTDLSEGDNIGRTSDSHIEHIKAGEENVDRSCVYAITRHDEQKRVVVIFRGTSNSGDWIKDILITQTKRNNPASDETNNSLPAYIRLHSGFVKALLNDNYVDTISLEVKEILERYPGYKLFVTGHSLGGALATLFGFYVAANKNPIYVMNGPVQVISVSSPRVGDKAFRDSFKFLEERGKLRHVRIHNARDKVPMLPYVGGKYKHVGLELKLRHAKYPVRFDYPRYEGWTQSSKSVSSWEQTKSIIEAVKYHGCELVRNRLKLFKAQLESTTLEMEYNKMWGMTH